MGIRRPTTRTAGITVACVLALLATFSFGPGLLRKMSPSLAEIGLSSLAYGYPYHVEFAQTAGLKPGGEVRVAGIPEGTVTTIRLAGQHVVADIVLQNDIPLGTQTTASIKMASVLGGQYIALVPQGANRLPHGGTIPLARTEVPYTLSELASDTQATIGKLDTSELSQLIQLLTKTFNTTPAVNHLALDQVTRLTEAVSGRDQQIQQLLAQTHAATDLVNGQSDSLFNLMQEGDTVIEAVHTRRALLHQLVVDTDTMAAQINELIHQNQNRINPTLDHLAQMLQVLTNDKGDLVKLVDQLAISGRYFNNIAATGPYVNVYLPYSAAPDQALCLMGMAVSCH